MEKDMTIKELQQLIHALKDIKDFCFYNFCGCDNCECHKFHKDNPFVVCMICDVEPIEWDVDSLKIPEKKKEALNFVKMECKKYYRRRCDECPMSTEGGSCLVATKKYFPDRLLINDPENVTKALIYPKSYSNFL